ncbi:MAG: hypothetical protein IPJ27_17500 [Candidatus Accumulibacter sp.]|uniref:Uncharacterized protein n=1 Tax=Candidatus Accumulibacter proximus TaxID=2954385 RepID=A0A935UIB0_9PROT|nr:hypothetical protein [Candidatus Accumulibacter proximus]
MSDDLFAPLRRGWETLLERLFFPPFPESVDSLALFSLLVAGLLIGEWLRPRRLAGGGHLWAVTAWLDQH